MKTPSFNAIKKIITCIFPFCLALTAPAQGVFQASLTTPPEDGAQLQIGDFWFKVDNNEVDFIAYVSALSGRVDSLNPVLTVPGNSVEFSLGEMQTGVFVNAQQTARNPFLPGLPLEPAGYDCDGNPYYLVSPGVMAGDYYSGHFDLPSGFLDELLAGNGKIEFNSFIVGNITVAAVPEPTINALGLLAGSCLFFMKRQKLLSRRYADQHRVTQCR